MQHSRQCRAPHAITLLIVMLTAAPGTRGAQPAEALLLSGRLATVEPSLRRVSVLPDGEVRLVDVFVPDGAEIREGDDELTLSALVIRVGYRVSVEYRMIDGRREATRIVIVSP